MAPTQRVVGRDPLCRTDHQVTLRSRLIPSHCEKTLTPFVRPATATGNQTVAVYGSGFTPSGTVSVNVYRVAGRCAWMPCLVASQLTTASPHHCYRFFCVSGGNISATSAVGTGCNQYFAVSAYDLSSGTWSNRVTLYVNCIP
jgi:hypothetical protein